MWCSVHSNPSPRGLVLHARHLGDGLLRWIATPALSFQHSNLTLWLNSALTLEERRFINKTPYPYMNAIHAGLAGGREGT